MNSLKIQHLQCPEHNFKIQHPNRERFEKLLFEEMREILPKINDISDIEIIIKINSKDNTNH